MSENTNNIVAWYAGHCIIISVGVSFLFSFLFYLIKASKKKWQFREIRLHSIINLFFAIYSIPQAIALVLCGFGLLKLEDIQGLNFYICISALALFYVSILAISNFLADEE
jgi:hypothetical protein